jgi:hypothetical protein
MTRFDRLCLSGLIPLGSMLSGCAADDGPERILHNGNILTVNPPAEAVHARARGDGVILAVAPDAAIMALQTARSDGLDLKDDSVLPRVVVAHKQPTLSALRSAAVEFSGCTPPRNAGAWAALKQAAANADKCASVDGWRALSLRIMFNRVSARSFTWSRTSSSTCPSNPITPMPIAVCSASSVGTPTRPTPPAGSPARPVSPAHWPAAAALVLAAMARRCSARRKCRRRFRVPAQLACT